MYTLRYQFGEGGRTISSPFPVPISPDATIHSLLSELTTRVSTWGQDPFVGARHPPGKISLYKMVSQPNDGLLGFDPMGHSPLQHHFRVSHYWPSAPEAGEVHILAYFHSETQEALTAAPGDSDLLLTFKVVLRRDGDEVKPDWKSFFDSNLDECEEDTNALPSEISDILEMSRKPYGCSKQEVHPRMSTF
ncbi:hypothetical protein E1B28_003197 [Marasmius oreades]|uniref:Uncharacterized protein n=1 Tax=Marasmius oreades TaxID=181124 RepID=A0A9P7UM38_9AGAR|nr:uncharacterized protein E1B28_003197 [Marasmius oreades]KAG7085651.1 hypothetical protein E1B28_003197 [Marasmius oreades]